MSLPTVYDPTTKQPITGLSAEEMASGIVSGKYALDADGAPVTLQGKSGKT